MGMIINIDEAMRLRKDYNIFREPLNAMLQASQEAWEKKNPIDLLYKRGTINKFQETFTDSIGFAHAFDETGDYAVAPIFNTDEGFSQTYTTKTFQGGFIVTKQVIEDGEMNKIADLGAKFMKAWHRDQVMYAMTGILSGFGKAQKWSNGRPDSASYIQLNSADTKDGTTGSNSEKNPLFTNAHKTIARRDGQAAITQSNVFCVSDGAQSPTYGLNLNGSDANKVAKLADVINQVITIMENYKDDNGQYAGVSGAKRIVAPNDARLKAALSTALSMEMFGDAPNPAYKRATMEDTPYLRDLPCCFKASGNKPLGFFIVDDEYQNSNHGLEWTQRVKLTMNVTESKNPYGISHDARERFDVNVCSWRGIAFVFLGDLTDLKDAEGGSASTWMRPASGSTYAMSVFDAIVPDPTAGVKPVSVVGTVSTDEVS